MTQTKNDLLENSGVWTGKIPFVGEVSLKDVSGDGFDYIMGGGAETDERGMFARIAVSTLCDEDGTLIFSRKELANVNKSMPFKRLKAIAMAAKEHCGLLDEGIDEIAEK